MIRMEVNTIQSFLDYFSKIRERTMRVVACIPPDKIEWRAAADKFTLGDLARHIAATERNVFVECACGGRKQLCRMWSRTGRGPRRGCAIHGTDAQRIDEYADPAKRRPIAAKVSVGGWNPDHHLEALALDGGARGSSSRRALRLPRSARCQCAAALRPYLRTIAGDRGSYKQRRRLRLS
jgi:hypothetical protein